MTSSFAVTAIPVDELVRARRPDADVAVDHLRAEGGEPLRCCLRNATPGEELILFGYRPPLPGPSPYQEEGAVFAHASDCAGPATTGYPEDWRGRPQVLRAYTSDGRIHPASRMHDGSDPERAVAEVLATEGVVTVHSRNVVYGCYMFAVSPATAGRASLVGG
jgi:hypothetical protein